MKTSQNYSREKPMQSVGRNWKPTPCSAPRVIQTKIGRLRQDTTRPILLGVNFFPDLDYEAGIVIATSRLARNYQIYKSIQVKQEPCHNNFVQFLSRHTGTPISVQRAAASVFKTDTSMYVNCRNLSVIHNWTASLHHKKKAINI